MPWYWKIIDQVRFKASELRCKNKALYKNLCVAIPPALFFDVDSNYLTCWKIETDLAGADGREMQPDSSKHSNFKVEFAEMNKVKVLFSMHKVYMCKRKEERRERVNLWYR